MDYFHTLEQLGLTQTQAETLLLLGAVAIGVGIVLYLFWNYILLAIGAFAILMVVNHHPKPVAPITQESPIEIKPVDPKEKENNVILQDCESLTHDYEMCKDHVAQRNEAGTDIKEAKLDDFKPAAEVKPLDVENPAYNTLRAAAILQPGAVILQKILR